ncbi:hypothetical protein [Crocosphaera sp.]|uniref:hypothetical protein n=1 Tax=Crocosphaera sp. TaxID=2729996 RepID=UPI002611A916|nr:hypothetical protein [Crocosphaera sp.]MDJ0579083.1 hypothetical protein [Crocosphaera sp.]
MAILTPADANTYAPDVTLTGDALNSALLFVQSIIESGKGANRPLEVTEFQERKDVNIKAQTVYFSHTPVLTEPTPVIKVRLGNIMDFSRNVISIGDWVTVEDDAYTLDIDGRLNFNKNFYRQFSYGFLGTRGHFGRHYTSECELTYSSGLDFTQNTFEINQLKAAAGKILSYIEGNNSMPYKGNKRLKVPFREFEVESSDKVLPGTIPDELFLSFVKYRPVIL